MRPGMTHVSITGGQGFLGRNLAARLAVLPDCALTVLCREDEPASCASSILQADLIFHLAGASRTEDPLGFERDNFHITAKLCALLKKHGRVPRIVFSSSIQAALNTDYGRSKLRAEEELCRFAAETGALVRIYRLSNVFGKWARPHHNSVVATFCHNVARGLPLDVHQPDRMVQLSSIDDVAESFVKEVSDLHAQGTSEMQIPVYPIRLGDLSEKITEFHRMAQSVALPDFSDPFTRALYATYLSYVPMQDLLRPVTTHANSAGMLFELFKEQHFGQILALRIPPGATRGNHSHHAKTERFIVLEGDGLIKLSPPDGTIQSFHVRGDLPQTIDIPPGIAHSISNVGARELLALVWSSCVFDPARPDTVPCPVDNERRFTIECETNA
jgi:UDP-2-acetamido-2,6-beta-L-arabino-hexul-4-ose reductase